MREWASDTETARVLVTKLRLAQESPEWDQWIQQAFDAFDVDGSGRLSYNELNQMLCGEVCAVCCRQQS